MARTAARGGQCSDEGADRARGRDDPPVACAVELVAEDRRPEHDERGEAEVRKGEADDRRPHPGSRDDLAEAIAKLDQEAAAFGAHMRIDLQQHEEERADDEARGVDREDPAGAHHRDQRARDGRAEDVQRVARHVEERVRRLQLLERDRLGNEPIGGRPEEGRGSPEDRTRHEEEGQRHVPGDQQHGCDRLHESADAVAREHHEPPRQPVGYDPADEREKHPGAEEHRQDAPEGDGRVPDSQDGEGQGDRDHRVPCRRGDAPKPEKPERALPQWAKRPPDSHSRDPSPYPLRFLRRFLHEMVVASGEVRLSKVLRREAGAEVDRLYRRHADEVFRYALMVMRSRPDAEDIAQIVFVRALKALERGEKVRTPRNWLIKIAHNECRRLLSSRKIHAELPEEIAVEPADPTDVGQLRAAMAELPEAQRKALCLRELEGRTYVEIATELDLTVSAVETLIFRARRTLREQLEASISCEDFALLLDDPSARPRIRAHARTCAECATLERQARGRKSVLKRIASILGLPMWGTKLAAVGLTAAAVVATTSAASIQHHRQHQRGTGVQTSVPHQIASRPVLAT